MLTDRRNFLKGLAVCGLAASAMRALGAELPEAIDLSMG